MSIKYDDLAVELGTKIGDLTALAETLNVTQGFNLPFAAKTTLTNEEAEQLRKAFREQPKASTAAQLNPAPVRNNDIQATEPSNVPVEQEEDPTAANLEILYQKLVNAKAAQDTQAQEIFENRIREIQQQRNRRGAMLRIVAEIAETEGYIAAENALTESNQAKSAEAFKRETELLAGTAGADFLENSYPNAAQSSTEIPLAPKSIAQPNLDILDLLRKL
jgi:hypothetical protein